MQNQVEFDFEGSELTRNVTPYNLFGDGVNTIMVPTIQTS